MILAAMQNPTYSQGVQDAIDAVTRLAERTRGETIDVRLVTSALRSLDPVANTKHERTRADIAEEALLAIATRVVAGALEDYAYAKQRPEPSFGNVISSVKFGPSDVRRWANYAAMKKHEPAFQLLKTIDCNGGVL